MKKIPFILLLITTLSFAQENIENEIKDLVFSGKSEGFQLKDDFGDFIILDGQPLKIPKHDVKLIIKDDKNLLVKVIGVRGSKTFKGNYKINRSDKKIFKIDGELISSPAFIDSININYPLYEDQAKFEFEISSKSFIGEISFNGFHKIKLNSSDIKITKLISSFNKEKITEKEIYFDNDVKITKYNTKNNLEINGSIKIFQGVDSYYILNLTIKTNSSEDYYIDNTQISYATIGKKPLRGKVLSKEEFERNEKKRSQTNSLLGDAIRQTGVNSLVNQTLRNAGVKSNINVNKKLGLNNSPSSSKDSYLQRVTIKGESNEIIKKYVLAKFDRNSSKIFFQAIINDEKLTFEEDQKSLLTTN